MKVVLIGKEEAKGTGKKSGKDFHNTLAHVRYAKNKVEGEAVEVLWLDPTSHPLADLMVGEVYNLDRDGRGYVIGFELA